MGSDENGRKTQPSGRAALVCRLTLNVLVPEPDRIGWFAENSCHLNRPRQPTNPGPWLGLAAAIVGPEYATPPRMNLLGSQPRFPHRAAARRAAFCPAEFNVSLNVCFSHDDLIFSVLRGVGTDERSPISVEGQRKQGWLC